MKGSDYPIAGRAPGDYMLGVSSAGQIKRYGDYPLWNMAIDGGMKVDQEHAGTLISGVSSTVAYITDKTIISKVGANVFSIQQVSDAPPGFSDSAKINVTTANASPGSTDRLTFYFTTPGFRMQQLNWGTANAQALSIGFWVRANRTGTYSGAVDNNTGTLSYPYSFTINAANTWEYKTVTIPGPTSAVWETGGLEGFGFFIALMMGSGLTASAGSWQSGSFKGVTGTINGAAATSDTMQVTGLSMVAGNTPVPQEMSPYFQMPFDEAYLLCQRFFEKSFNYATPCATNAGVDIGEHMFVSRVGASGAVDSGKVSFATRKRLGDANLAITIFNPSAANAQIRDTTGGFDCSASTIASKSETGFRVSATVNASTTAGNILRFHWMADARINS
jgi:hypothetical protein